MGQDLNQMLLLQFKEKNTNIHSDAHHCHDFIPVVLSRQSEDGEQRPAKIVVAGVAVVWVFTRPHAGVAIWTVPERVDRDAQNP